MSTSMPIYTTRLALQPFAERDAAELLAMFRDKEVRRYLLDDTVVDADWVAEEIGNSARRFQRGELGLYAARSRIDGALVGFCGLRPFSDPPQLQLIYGLLPSQFHQGFATEMARAVIDAAFLRCSLPALVAVTDVPNVASARVLERLKFERIDGAPAAQQLRFRLSRAHYRPRIRAATAADREAVQALNQAAFGRPDEANLVEALEAGGHVVASLVATVGDEPVGHILFTELPLLSFDGSRRVRGVALAPVAVLPQLQQRGIGGALIEAGLSLCRDQGAAAAVVLGHAEYYPRFGFSAQRALSIHAPWSGRPSFMALELIAGALDGEWNAVYAPPFFAS